MPGAPFSVVDAGYEPQEVRAFVAAIAARTDADGDAVACVARDEHARIVDGARRAGRAEVAQVRSHARAEVAAAEAALVVAERQRARVRALAVEVGIELDDGEPARAVPDVAAAATAWADALIDRAVARAARRRRAADDAVVARAEAEAEEVVADARVAAGARVAEAQVAGSAHLAEVERETAAHRRAVRIDADARREEIEGMLAESAAVVSARQGDARAAREAGRLAVAAVARRAADAAQQVAARRLAEASYDLRRVAQEADAVRARLRVLADGAAHLAPQPDADEAPTGSDEAGVIDAGRRGGTAAWRTGGSRDERRDG